MILKSSDPAKPTTAAPNHLKDRCKNFKIRISFKILNQDLEKSAHRRCTNWSKSPAVSNFPERKGPPMSKFPGRKGPPMSTFQGAVWAAVYSVMSARGTSCTRPWGVRQRDRTPLRAANSLRWNFANVRIHRSEFSQTCKFVEVERRAPSHRRP